MWRSIRKKCPSTIFSGLRFPAFRLNAQICRANHRILEIWENADRKNPNTDIFYEMDVIVGITTNLARGLYQNGKNVTKNSNKW